MLLTDSKVKGLKPQSRVYRVNDGRGLCVEVRKSGSKFFKFRYVKPDGKSTMLSLGQYPDISLAQARDKAQEKRSMLANGMDVSTDALNTFEDVFRDWHSKNLSAWSEDHAQVIVRRMENNILPWIGKKHISEITALNLLPALEKVEKRGAVETAHRTLQYTTKVFSYAISKRLIDRNPAVDIKGALTPSVKKHYPALTDPARVSEILQAIDSYKGSFITKCGLNLLFMSLLRPGELRHGRWSEIDWDEGLWIIPGSRMKMKKNKRMTGNLDHIVPLSTQALNILRELHPLTSKSEYVFPSEYSKDRPMSENTMNVALRRMGYTKDEIVSHSFRTIASTLLNERNWPSAWIEKQLAHIDQNLVRGIYNRAQYLPQRKRMLQSWADFLDYLRQGGTSIKKLKQGQEIGLAVHQ